VENSKIEADRLQENPTLKHFGIAMNIYVDLTNKFNEGRLRAILSSGGGNNE
jgi:hypothetical protein